MKLYLSTAMILSTVIYAYCHQLTIDDSIKKEITYNNLTKETVKKKSPVSPKENHRGNRDNWENKENLPIVHEIDLVKLSAEVKSLYDLYKNISRGNSFNPKILT
jgi:hypothetical protein